MGKELKKKSVSKKTREKPEWILFFYTVPSKPVKNRIKFWRRLVRAGAVQLKGAVYVLPHNKEHYEFCQWLMAEVAALGGEGDFVITDKAVKKIAELVHELDIKDEKFSSPEAKGIGEILLGIRKTGRDNKDILKKGIDVFEMIYASKI